MGREGGCFLEGVAILVIESSLAGAKNDGSDQSSSTSSLDTVMVSDGGLAGLDRDQ